MDGKLFCEIIQRIKAVAGIKTLLILAMAALYLTVMSRRIGANQFMPDAQLSGGKLKQSGQIPSAGAETIGKFKAIVRLDAFHPDTSASVPLEQLFQKVGGGIGRPFGIGSQKTQVGEFVNGGVLVET